MFHLRFTPYDISGYTFDFLESYASLYIVAFEDKDKYGKPTEKHYHVYIETDYDLQTVRKEAKTALKIPTTGGRGRNNKYFAFISNWQDPGYVCKWNEVVRSKGYSEKQIMDYVISGKQKYLNKVEKSPDVLVASTGCSRSRVSVDKEVIGECITFFELAKKRGETPSANQLVEEACRVVRSYGKGINPYKIREYVLAVWFEVGDREHVVERVLKML